MHSATIRPRSNHRFRFGPYYCANQTDTWRGTTSRDNTLARWAVELNAHGSNDLDGNAITYEWFVYDEAGTYSGELPLITENGPTTGFTAPAVQQVETIHVVLRVQDNGAPSLCAYRRAIITVTP
ncbi:hypothetical protein SH449x_003054 [Pirellulaceae bacterium SH449]